MPASQLAWRRRESEPTCPSDINALDGTSHLPAEHVGYHSLGAYHVPHFQSVSTGHPDNYSNYSTPIMSGGQPINSHAVRDVGYPSGGVGDVRPFYSKHAKMMERAKALEVEQSASFNDLEANMTSQLEHRQVKQLHRLHRQHQAV